MKVFVLLFLMLITFSLLAQNRCATPAYMETVPYRIINEPSNSKASQPQKNTAPQGEISEESIIRIPVVIHVLYNQSSHNITDAQIRSGLDAMNRDFRMKNADRVNTPKQFRNAAADIQIEFYLATADPFGRKTTGIERKYTSRNGWMADDKIKLASLGGLDAWDSKSYLNIWIGNIMGGSGYSTVPGSDAKTDGIVIHYAAFGTINTAVPFNLGRTAVHEAGHWLGLKHIWGDSQCGDDGIEDTPQQGFFTQGCPTGFRTSCSNSQTGDMYMNFMDYTNDACMSLFTAGQRNRMRANFDEGGARATLLLSRGLSDPWTADKAPLPTASIFPNPASDKITFQVSSSLLGKSLTVFNKNGQVQKQIVLQTTQPSISIAGLLPGVYFLRGENFSQKFIKL